MYVFTANAFPYGAFKGERVKEQVYEPDWRTDERAAYTMRVARRSCGFGRAGHQPSINRLHFGYKPRVTGPEVVKLLPQQLHGVVAYLADLEAKTGRTVTLAIEPEPSCYIELTSELIDYFTNHLYRQHLSRRSRADGLVGNRVRGAPAQTSGAVYDICHQAVEYETIAESLEACAKRAYRC